MSPVRFLRAAASKLRRLARDTRAVAAVEFALILPPLLVLYLGSMEGSSLITIDRRVQIISGTIGDLVARWDPEAGAIPQSALDDYFSAAAAIIYPYPGATLGQVVTLVEIDDDGNATVVKSCAYNGASARLEDSTYALPTNLKTVAQNASGFLVASEASYTYTPTLGDIFIDPFPLYNESFYLPRFEQAVTLPAGC